MELTRILIKPVISEKSFASSEKDTYVFAVAPEANKIEIKKAVEKLFKVNVTGVRVVNIEGKIKRVGRKTGKRSDIRKAYISIKHGQKIEEFKGL